MILSCIIIVLWAGKTGCKKVLFYNFLWIACRIDLCYPHNNSTLHVPRLLIQTGAGREYIMMC